MQCIMKFTQEQVKQIIKEEIENYVFEVMSDEEAMARLAGQTMQADFDMKKRMLALTQQKSKSHTPGPLNIPPEEEWEEKRGVKIPPGFQFDDPMEDPSLSDEEGRKVVARTLSPEEVVAAFAKTLSTEELKALEKLDTKEKKDLGNAAKDKTRWEALKGFLQRKLRTK